MVYLQLMICLQKHTKVFQYITPMGEKCLKRILAYLDCTKHSEININHLHIQKHVSYKKNLQKVEMCVQAYTKVFRYIASNGGRRWVKTYFNTFTFH